MEISKLAVELAGHGCILVGEFKLSSGLTSPYYIDLRSAPSHPKLFEMISEAYIHRIKGLKINFDRIAGIAVAGIPIATLVAYKIKKPLVYIRKEEKGYGTQRLLEGVVNKDDVVLLLDDVATTGNNLRYAVNILRESGAKVKHTMVLVDREQRAKENLATVGVKLVALTTSSELIKQLHLRGIVTKGDYEMVIEYIRREKNV